MDLVIDANVFLSTLISPSGKTSNLLFNERLKLFAPEWLLEEFEEHKTEILEKTKLAEEEFELFLSIISARVEFIPKIEFENYLKEAETLTPDKDDREYFALALKLKANIWTNDKKFKEQNKILVYNTTELLTVFNSTN